MGNEQFKFPSMREEFEANYKPVERPAKNRRGFKIEYVYVGPWYLWRDDCGNVGRLKRGAFFACLAGIALYTAAALQSSPVNSDRLVSITGLLSLAPFIFELFGVVQFLAAKERMTKEQFRDISGKLRIAPVLHAALLSLTGALAVRAAVAGGLGWSHFLIPAGYGLAALEACSIYVRFRALRHREVEQAPTRSVSR